MEILRGDGPESYVVRLAGMDQSHVDLADPTRIAFDYVRRMADVVDVHAEPGVPVRMVHVGRRRDDAAEVRRRDATRLVAGGARAGRSS